jgi:LuxR family maltose regulon positive regulatory protein
MEGRMLAQLSDFRLTSPPLPPRHVPRPRLLAALDEAADVPLTLVSAGAGAGKTVLLTEWALAAAEPVVWLTLSPVDARPPRFWRLLATALHRAGLPSLLVTGREELESADRATWARNPVPVQSKLATRRPTVVIDGAHLIKDLAVLAALDRLVRTGNEGPRWVLLARSDPLLPLHRYRLMGLMRELRGSDLAMTRDEVRTVLAAHGVALAPREFERLVASTEGWAAGVRLLAMRMEGQRRPGDVVSRLAVDQGSIGEYLLEEVLADQPDTVRRMLVQTSFLEEISGPLASAVTGIDRCGQILDELARTNSFVVPVDRLHTRFRYHQLFRDVLRYLLQRDGQPDLASLCRRASAWFENQGDLSSAAYWALREGDRRHIVRLLTRGALAHAFVCRSDTSGWELPGLATLTPNGSGPGQSDADTALIARVVAALVADGELAATILADDAHAEPLAGEPAVLVTWDLAEMILAQKAGQPSRVLAAAGRLLGRDPQPSRSMPSGFYPAVMLASAMAYLWEGRHQDCANLLTQSLKEAERSHAVTLQTEILGALALVESYSTRSNRAEVLANRAEDLVSADGLEPPESLYLANRAEDLVSADGLEPPESLYLGSALRCLMRADLHGLDEALNQVLFRDVVGSEPGFEAALTILRASRLMMSGEQVEAHALVRNSRRYLAPPLLQTVLDAQVARIEHMLGRPHAALQILEAYPTAYELAMNPREMGLAYLVATTRAHAQLAVGEPGEAARSVRALLTSTNPQIGRYQIVDGLICAAVIACAQDDQVTAVEMLSRALQVADGDISLPMLQMTDALAGVLVRHPSVAARWPVAVVSSEPAAVPASSARSGFPAVTLTDRERAVLRLLATGLATADIAGELCVSVNTVKTHLAAIYRKLPARRRREAVIRARELELL